MEQIATALYNLQLIIRQLHNAQLDVVRPQISQKVVNSLHQQLENIKMAVIRERLATQVSFVNNHQSILKEAKISMPNKFDGTKVKFYRFIQ